MKTMDGVEIVKGMTVFVIMNGFQVVENIILMAEENSFLVSAYSYTQTNAKDVFAVHDNARLRLISILDKRKKILIDELQESSQLLLK